MEPLEIDLPLHFLPVLLFYLRFRLSVLLTDLSTLLMPSRNAPGVLHASPPSYVTIGALPPLGCQTVAHGNKRRTVALVARGWRPPMPQAIDFIAYCR